MIYQLCGAALTLSIIIERVSAKDSKDESALKKPSTSNDAPPNEDEYSEGFEVRKSHLLQDLFKKHFEQLQSDANRRAQRKARPLFSRSSYYSTRSDSKFGQSKDDTQVVKETNRRARKNWQQYLSNLTKEEAIVRTSPKNMMLYNRVLKLKENQWLASLLKNFAHACEQDWIEKVVENWQKKMLRKYKVKEQPSAKKSFQRFQNTNEIRRNRVAQESFEAQLPRIKREIQLRESLTRHLIREYYGNTSDLPPIPDSDFNEADMEELQKIVNDLNKELPQSKLIIPTFEEFCNSNKIKSRSRRSSGTGSETNSDGVEVRCLSPDSLKRHSRKND